MNKSGRGRTGGSKTKPAEQIEIRYGAGLLRQESAAWPAYALVATPTALETAQPHLAKPPTGVVHAQWLDSGHQRELASLTPDDVELVVGLGGGRALDASKFVALEKDVPLIMVPTIVSSGAIIHGHVATWRGRRLHGLVDDWPWVDCEYVLVDYGVALAAPPNLHTAGLGDILCGYAGPVESQWCATKGYGALLDPGVAEEFDRYHQGLVDGFLQTLDQHGNLTAGSIKQIMTALQMRDSARPKTSGGKSGDHPFWIALELINDRTWIHGELVALGAVIISWQADSQPERLIQMLESCQVRFRPEEMGLSYSELRRGLEFVPTYMAEERIHSVLRHEPVTERRFDELWTFLSTC
jgi:glycerol-1-phosphate dehydrogenase [NAD(P)+]